MSKRKNLAKIREENEFLREVSYNNIQAIKEGPTIKKKWTLHDLAEIQPLTPTQEDMFHAWYNNQHIIAHGTAGTGKSFLAMYLGFEEILNPKYDAKRLIIVRSNVPTREVGHLPGTLEEKMSEYERPYHDICAELFDRRSTYLDMKNAGLIAFMPTSFVRGLTWNNCIVLIEEIQNLTFHEISSIVTRVGIGTRIIITGDTLQADLPFSGRDKSGIKQLLEVAKDIGHFSQLKFTRHDIVRSDFVKSWIIAIEDSNLVAA